MSNVLVKNRTISRYQFYTGFVDIMDKCYLYFYDMEKFSNGTYEILCVPLLQTLASIHQNIIIANGIYPINDHEVMIRRDYQNIAINQLEWAMCWIEFIMRKIGLELEKDQDLKTIVYSIHDEINHLKVWRQQNNSLMKKFRELNSDKDLGISAAEAKLAIVK